MDRNEPDGGKFEDYGAREARTVYIDCKSPSNYGSLISLPSTTNTSSGHNRRLQ